jgi:thiol-disulfide isomerase/thioredoxin
MNAKASDYTPPQLESEEEDKKLPTDLDLKLFADSQPTDTPTTGTTGEKNNSDLDITTDPFGKAFNELGPVTPPKPTDGQLPDILTDPFAPEFTNLPKPGEVSKPENKGTKGGESNDPFDPFSEWTLPGDLFPSTPDAQPSKPGEVTPPQDAEPKPDTAKPEETVKPDEPAKPGDQPAKPGDAPKEPNPVFNENNVGDAIKLAQSKNQPIYVFSSPNGQLDQAQQDAIKANAAEAVFVNINFAKADQMMRAGLETTNYWQLANLCGAGGDVNNLYQKPGFMGRFNASDFNANDPKNSLKAAATGDIKTIFAGQVKPPSPQPDAPVQPETPKVGPETPQPQTPRPDAPKPDSSKPEAPKDGPEGQKETTENQPEKKGPVKLDQLKFDSYSFAEAIKTAKENNLPLVVYKGADFCGSCPRVSAAVDSFANELKNKPTTDAVIVKLNYEATRDNIQRNDPELFKMIDQIMPINNSRFPEVAVYNPNDMSKPLRQDASGRSLNGYGGDINHLRNLVAAGRENLGTTQSAPGTDRQQDRSSAKESTKAESSLPAGVMGEADVQAAQQAAKAKNVPMLSYLESAKGANENLAKAMQYLSENGLASAVKINRQTADGMLQRGLETSKFYALKNAMLRTPDVAQDGGSHLSAFAPGSFDKPAGCTEAAKTPDEIVSFLKKSGVDLSKGNSEAAVRALLEGKPVPPPPEPAVEKPDATPVEPEAKKTEVKPQPEVKPQTEVKPEPKPELPPQPETSRPEQAPPPQVVPPQVEVKPEVTPENFKPEGTPQPEQKPELGVKPEAPKQINPEPMVLPTPPESATPSVKPEVKPAYNFEPTLPREGDILPAKAEKEAEKQSKFKAKDAEEALKVIEEAKARGVDLVVHSPTVICSNDQCIMTKLPDVVSDDFAKEAVFLEIPRGGLKNLPEGAQYDALRAINDLYKVSSEDHKTKIDLHVYSLNKDKAYQLNDEGVLGKQIETAIKDKGRLPHLR